MEQLLENVGNYVVSFLQKTLSPELHFHNINHTLEVVAAVKEIGFHSRLSDSEMTILVTAAWFHDCGYSKVYVGHEEESKKIAEHFLNNQRCRPAFITDVLNVIEATKFPQYPKSSIDNAICDADLYHFTKPDYPKYEAAIRQELETFLGKKYSDSEWQRVNCKMLGSHSYFTDYGKKVLVKFKEANVRLLGCDID